MQIFSFSTCYLLAFRLPVLIKHKMDRRTKRLQRMRDKAAAKSRAANDEAEQAGVSGNVASSDEKFAKLLAQKEDVLLNFVADINKIYQETLERPPPFVSFVICGMQSSGKSTIMER